MNQKKTVFKTDWFFVEEEYGNHHPSYQGKPFYRIVEPDCVIILALTDAKEILMVRQFRPAISMNSLELPAGMIDKSETPVEAAKRELYEESGYVCHTIQELGSGRLMLNRYNNRVFAFLGIGAKKDSNFKNDEGLEVVLVSGKDLKEMVKTDRFDHYIGLTLILLAEWKQGYRID